MHGTLQSRSFSVVYLYRMTLGFMGFYKQPTRINVNIKYKHEYEILYEFREEWVRKWNTNKTALYV